MLLFCGVLLRYITANTVIYTTEHGFFSRNECAPWASSKTEEPDVQLALSGSDQRKRAYERRCQEIGALQSEGIPVVAVDRWHYSVGPVHLWPYAGRWLNEMTGARGRLKSVSIRASDHS